MVKEMEKKGKIIIGVVVAILVILVAGFLLISSSDVTLQANDVSLTLPNNYTVDENAVANSEDVYMLFSPVIDGSKKNEKEFFDTIKQNGKDAGYENVTDDKINGYTVYSYAAHPDKLKNVSSNKEYSGDSYSWMTYEPYLPYKGVTSVDVDHYRMVTYVKGDNVYYLSIFTDNPDTSLYSPEIDNITHTIQKIEK